MALTNDHPAAGDETSDAAEGDATKRDVVRDGGSDAAVDPGLVIPPVEPTTQPGPDKSDDRESTNHTGLTPDSIPVD